MILDSIDNFIGKSFAGYIFYFCVWPCFQNCITDSVHQMGFSKTGISINKKRIINITWIVSYCLGCRCGKAIGITDYKSFKTLFWVDIAFKTFFIIFKEGICFIMFCRNF